MPWRPSEATKYTKKARSPKAKRQWAAVSNSMLKRGASEGAAIRGANSVLKKRGRKRRAAGRS